MVGRLLLHSRTGDGLQGAGTSALSSPFFTLDFCLAAAEVDGAGFVPPDKVEGFLCKASALICDLVWDRTEATSICSS